MKKRDFLNRSLAAAVACHGVALPRAARAQERLLRLIVPYAPGGGVDLQARALMAPLASALSRKVVVENRAGGNTRIATESLKNAAADGNTLMLMPAVAWIGFVAAGVFDYEPWKVLVPVAQTAETPYNFLQTKAGSGLDSWAKLREHALRTPGGIKVGGPSSGGFIGYTVDEVFRRGGIQGVYAPYTGSGPAHIALLGGIIDVQILPFGDGMGNVGSGATHPIAVSSAQRHPRAPGVPTFAELGIGDTLLNNFSLWAAPGTPADQVAELAAAVRAATDDSAFRTLMEDRLAFSVAFRNAASVLSDLAAVDRVWSARLKTAR